MASCLYMKAGSSILVWSALNVGFSEFLGGILELRGFRGFRGSGVQGLGSFRFRGLGGSRVQGLVGLGFGEALYPSFDSEGFHLIFLRAE